MRQVHLAYWLPSLVLGCSGPAPEWIPPTGAATSSSSTEATAAPTVTPTTGQTGSNATSGATTSATTTPTLDGATPPSFNYDGAPFFSRAVQLTNEQWANSVRDVLKLDATPTQANSFLRPVGGFTTFINNERVLEVTNDMRDSYRLAAEEIALQVNTEAAITKVDAGTDADTFVATFGRRAFRRPLTTDETTRYKTLFDKALELSGDESDFVKGASLVVQAMLQSPNFIYRTESTADGQRLSGFEIAARLSYWLANTTPSDALLDKAQAGTLDTDEGVKSTVSTLLDAEPAMAVHTEMHAELFKFSRYREIVKFSEEYNPDTNAELDQASRLFFDRIYSENLGLKDILTSTQGYAGPEMAKLYGKPATTQMSLMDFGAERPGFFAQVPYLALFGDDDHSDAIHRGLFINFQVLCAKLPKPSDGVPLPPEPMAGQQDRERMEKHTGVGTCGASCHGNYINPLGFAFENFDGLGRYRTEDQERPVNATSAYPFATGMTEFTGARELMDILANSDEAHACYAKNLMSYALQRDITAGDAALVDELAAISKSGTGGLKALILELAQSPAFLTRQVTSL
jgi:hypothetical protein